MTLRAKLLGVVYLEWDCEGVQACLERERGFCYGLIRV